MVILKDLLDAKMISCEKPEICNSIDNLPLAYAYVPYQQYETPYSAVEGLKYGTVFPSLNKPMRVYGNEFFHKEGVKNI